MVDVGDLVDTGDGAVRRAALFGNELASNIVDGVLGERLGREATLLRAIMNQSIFADVEIARAGATAPCVWLAVCNRVLEVVEARIILLLERLHQAIDFALFFLQRLELSAAVMNDADRRSKSELQGARSHF